MNPINKKLRKWCSKHQCQIRLPGCKGGPCVGAHFRMAGLSGMGQKPHDLFVAISCPHCHDIVDGRKDGRNNDGSIMDWKDARASHLQGVLRTQKLIIEEGLISWK